jgi:predicted transcriptional regulator
MNKETILAAFSDMPAQVTLDEVVERLIFIEKVEKGLRQSEAGQTVSQEEIKKLANSWSK